MRTWHGHRAEAAGAPGQEYAGAREDTRPPPGPAESWADLEMLGCGVAAVPTASALANRTNQSLVVSSCSLKLISAK